MEDENLNDWPVRNEWLDLNRGWVEYRASREREWSDVINALTYAGQSAACTVSEFRRQTDVYRQFLERILKEDGFKPNFCAFDETHATKEPDQKISYDEVMGFGS